MPTSRYCDHAPCSTSTCLTRAASADPGFNDVRLPPRMPAMRARIASALAGVAARLLLDDALEHALDEGDAGGLDRLQVARREQARQRRVEIGSAVVEQCTDAAQRSALRAAYERGDVVTLERGAGRGERRRKIDDGAVGAHGDGRGPSLIPGPTRGRAASPRSSRSEGRTGRSWRGRSGWHAGAARTVRIRCGAAS